MNYHKCIVKLCIVLVACEFKNNSERYNKLPDTTSHLSALYAA